jgi:hypothetical protein
MPRRDETAGDDQVSSSRLTRTRARIVSLVVVVVVVVVAAVVEWILFVPFSRLHLVRFFFLCFLVLLGGSVWSSLEVGGRVLERGWNRVSDRGRRKGGRGSRSRRAMGWNFVVISHLACWIGSTEMLTRDLITSCLIFLGGNHSTQCNTSRRNTM